jgi:streptomycin 6-kinase
VAGRAAGLLTDLARRWSITVGPALPGGHGGYAVRARTAGGRPAVLKLIVPGPYAAREIATIVAASGHGYVRLLAYDVERYAMLQEALGPSLERLGTPPERAIRVLCATLRQAWRLPPAELAGVVGWHSGQTSKAALAREEKAAGLRRMVTQLWDSLGRRCPERVVAQAIGYASRRAAAVDLDRCVVVHGDPHPGNALRVAMPRTGAESGFVFVDPDGYLADPAYDLGVVLRDWCPYLCAGDAPALARRYCRLLARQTGIDETAIWEWGFLERVSTGLYLMSLGAEERARPFLHTAEQLLA